MLVFLKILSIGVEVVVSFLLIAIILMQRSKGGGGLGGAAFGGGMGESILGARAGNVLTKATIILGIIFLLNTLLLSGLTTKQNRPRSIVSEAPAPAPVPAAPSIPGGAPTPGTPAAPAAPQLSPPPEVPTIPAPEPVTPPPTN